MSGADPGRGRTAQALADLALRTRVEAELAADPNLDAAAVGISVVHGVVTLTGHVDSFAEQFAAEHAVLRVGGVRAMAEALEVRRTTTADADAGLAEVIADRLDREARAPQGRIAVKVQDGHVTLTGEVDHEDQRQAVLFGLRGLTGVWRVSNLITVRSPPPATREADVTPSC